MGPNRGNKKGEWICSARDARRQDMWPKIAGQQSKQTKPSGEPSGQELKPKRELKDVVCYDCQQKGHYSERNGKLITQETRLSSDRMLFRRQVSTNQEW